MFISKVCAATAIILSLAAAPALADGGKHKNKKHRSHGYEHVYRSKGCPPGLAKKHNGCTPPGLAKQYRGHDDDDEDYDDYRPRYRRVDRGDYLGDYDYRYIDDPYRYQLEPLRRGERYAVIGNQVVRVDSDTGRILDLMAVARALLN